MGDWTRFADAVPDDGYAIEARRSGAAGSWVTRWSPGAMMVDDVSLAAAARSSDWEWRYPDPHPSQVEAIERDVLRRVARAMFVASSQMRESATARVAQHRDDALRILGGHLTLSDAAMLLGWDLGDDPWDPDIAESIFLRDALRAEGLPVGGDDA